ncbi:hypothetical protein evm_001825 [Chilo suppressalis]|nr:hypothetical protein evm_001825 [Chilo suppressalis]
MKLFIVHLFYVTMAVCVAVIGKDNSPLYIGGIGNDTNTDNELSRQWLVHTALDALEERLASNNSNTTGANTNNTRTDLRDLYLGLLYSTDTHKIYGYVTNTRIKLVLVTSSTSPSGSNIRDAEVRTALRRLHALYADAICNPFHLPGDQITSSKFDKQVKNLMLNNV